ncbi:MAG: T9SS type A sorting domain-containing protein [Melioribacteraceae bacterium]
MRRFILLLLTIALTTGIVYSQKKNITVVYQCNMEIERLSGRFNPATDTVMVRGEFNGWGTTSKMTASTLNPDLYVFERTAEVASGDTLTGYKFYYTPGTWEGGSDRKPIVTATAYNEGVLEVTRAFNDGTLETVTAQATTVTFVVDASAPKSAVNNSDMVATTVHLLGNLSPLQWPDLGWPDDQITRAIAMYDDGTHGDAVAADKKFTTQVVFPAYSNLNIEYKFGVNYGNSATNGGGNDNENGVGANHILILTPTMSATTITTTFGDMTNFVMSNTVKATKKVTVIYTCNMEIERLSGRFNPATDTVYVRGAFNGWGTTSMMTASTLNPDLYTYITPETYDVAFGDTLGGYKFYYTPSAWEGGSDRRPIVTKAAYDAQLLEETRTFNDGSLETITSNPAKILFVVDCSKNPLSAVNNSALVPTTVHILGNTPPLQWPDLGWPDAQITRAIALADGGANGDAVANDKIYSGYVTFPAYTGFNIEYKYGINFGNAATNGGGNDNENGVGANHLLTLEKDLTSATITTTFGDMVNFTITDKVLVTGVESDTDVIPSTYTLDQNYPNPFNPSTTIRFTTPEAGFVSMKVYNLIGQEVASLINREMSAGIHTVNFDASKLTSGIYFYSINSGKFSATKKMILMK